MHLNALLISKLKLEKLILPYRCPDVYKRIAKSRGISIQGYSAVENGADFAASKRDILNELWLFDGVFAALCYAILLYKAGMDFENVVKTTCFIANMEYFSAFNQIYSKYFVSKPARSCVEVSRLPKNVLVEVELIAKK